MVDSLRPSSRWCRLWRKKEKEKRNKKKEKEHKRGNRTQQWRRTTWLARISLFSPRHLILMCMQALLIGEHRLDCSRCGFSLLVSCRSPAATNQFDSVLIVEFGCVSCAPGRECVIAVVADERVSVEVFHCNADVSLRSPLGWVHVGKGDCQAPPGDVSWSSGIAGLSRH